MSLVNRSVRIDLNGASSDEEEVLSPPRAPGQLPPAPSSAQAEGTPGRFTQLSQHIHTAYKMARSGTRRRNATVSTPAAAGKSAAAVRPRSAVQRTERAGEACASKAAAQAADRGTRSQRRKARAGTPPSAAAKPAAVAAKDGRKRAAAAVQGGDGKENRPQASSPAGEHAAAAGVSPGKRQRRSFDPSPAGERQQPPAKPAASPLRAASPTRAAAASVAQGQAVQSQAVEAVRAMPPSEEALTSMGPQPSESLHDSILKSPTPPKRAKRTASTAAGGLPALAAWAAVPPAAPQLPAVEPGAVDQQPEAPLAVPQAQQGAVPADGAGPSCPPHAAKRPRPSPAKQQQQQQHASGAEAGTSAAAAAHPQPSPRRQSPRLQSSPEGSAEGRRSEVVASTPAAKPRGAADEEADAWWDPQDPAKVDAVRAALHVGGYSRGRLPLCREAQAERVGWWLAGQLAARRGGSIYLSGLPGTGKSLTAHEVVRQCWRAPPAKGAAPAPPDAPPTAAPSLDPPPALLSINCASLKGPAQVAERILLGFEQACRSPHPAAAMEAGHDSVLYPAEVAAGSGVDGSDGPGAGMPRAHHPACDGDPLQRLRRLVVSPGPGWGATGGAEPAAAAAPAKGKGRKAKGKAGGKRKSRRSFPEAGTGGCQRGMVVVVLDELDMLLAGPKGCEVVEQLFVLAAAPASRLVLLGIANSIDLVPRLLRPGGALHRHNLHPAHEQFPAYTSKHFSQVLHQRLSSLPGRVFAPAAIELCSRKMANASGDMRVALTACERAVAAVVSEATAAAAEADLDAAEAAAMADAGLGPALGRPRSPRGVSGGPAAAAARQRRWLVGLPHMAATLAAITGGIGLGNDNVRAIRALPPQQKLLLCTLGKLGGELLNSRGVRVRCPAATPGSSRGGRACLASPAGSAASSRKSSGSLLSGGSGAGGVQRSREVHLGQLREAFTQLCRQVGLEPYTDIECGTACEALEDGGLLRLTDGRGAAGRLVALRVPEEDVLLALSDVPVLCGVVGADDGAAASSAP